MTLTQAAKSLDRLRNDRVTPLEDLAVEVDSIGVWLATQKNGKLVSKLLSECHELRARIDSGCLNQFRFPCNPLQI